MSVVRVAIGRVRVTIGRRPCNSPLGVPARLSIKPACVALSAATLDSQEER
jgi:hypothetical protein